MVALLSLTSLCAVPLSLPSFLSALCAGVAAVAVEVVKDKNYVAAVGVCFYSHGIVLLGPSGFG